MLKPRATVAVALAAMAVGGLAFYGAFEAARSTDSGAATGGEPSPQMKHRLRIAGLQTADPLPPLRQPKSSASSHASPPPPPVSPPSSSTSTSPPSASAQSSQTVAPPPPPPPPPPPAPPGPRKTIE